MEERSLDERLLAVRGFFDDAAWKSIGAVERTRRANIFDNFRIMQCLGLTEGKPDFVVEFEKRLEAARLKEEAKLAGGDRKRKAAADCAVVDERSPTERVVCLVHRLLSLNGARQSAKVLCGRVDAAADPPAVVKMPKRVRKQAAKDVDAAPTAAERVVRRGRPSARQWAAVQQGERGAVASAVAGRAVARPKRRRAAAKEVTAAVEEAAAVNCRPKRHRKAVNYADVEHALDVQVVDNARAEFIYCFHCKKDVLGSCSDHKMVFIEDRPGVEQGTEKYARRSCPSILSVSRSRVHGRGVWSDKIIPAGYCFGPYKGQRKWFRDDTSLHTWQIGLAKDGDRFFVDAQSEEWGNYLRFVNHAKPSKCQLHAFEMDRQMWYVTTKEVRMGVELFVGYGTHYARFLNEQCDQDDDPVYDLSGVFACGQCEDVYSSAALLDAHVKHRHQPKAVAASAEKRHRCSTCAYATDNICNLRKHERVHTGERPFTCAQCPAAFTQACALKLHSRTHTGERPFKCAQCPAAFTVACNLERHSRAHTGEQPFACSVCGRSFGDKGNLNSHRLIHEGVKLYKCEQCDERFSQLCNLTVHSRVHSGERPYACAKCPATFTVACDLKSHSRRHLGERPFACTDCGKAFSDKSDLNRHRRIHEGVKAFKCNYCSKRFTQSAHLTRHVRLHTGEKPYACSFCGKSFSQSSSCREHKKSQHPP